MFPVVKALYTSIYFMEETNFITFHRLTADEIWYFVILLTVYDYSDTTQKQLTLAWNIQILHCVPPFGEVIDKDYKWFILLFGFEFDDFELFEKGRSIRTYPEHKR